MSGIEFIKQTKAYRNPNLPKKEFKICTLVHTKFNSLLRKELTSSIEQLFRYCLFYGPEELSDLWGIETIIISKF
jgi:hypothetical protein